MSPDAISEPISIDAPIGLQQCPVYIVAPVCDFKYEPVVGYSNCGDPKVHINMCWACSSGATHYIEMQQCTEDCKTLFPETGDTTSDVRPCPEYYRPVCGVSPYGDAKTYDNPCFACNDLQILGYHEGRCYNERIGGICEIPKPDPSEIACLAVYMPVCGYDEDGNYREYGNSCEACLAPEVVRWVDGTCDCAGGVDPQVPTCDEVDRNR